MAWADELDWLDQWPKRQRSLNLIILAIVGFTHCLQIARTGTFHYWVFKRNDALHAGLRLQHLTNIYKHPTTGVTVTAPSWTSICWAAQNRGRSPHSDPAPKCSNWGSECCSAEVKQWEVFLKIICDLHPLGVTVNCSKSAHSRGQSPRSRSALFSPDTCGIQKLNSMPHESMSWGKHTGLHDTHVPEAGKSSVASQISTEEIYSREELSCIGGTASTRNTHHCLSKLNGPRCKSSRQWRAASGVLNLYSWKSAGTLKVAMLFCTLEPVSSSSSSSK